jgi:hypothetical protein
VFLIVASDGLEKGFTLDKTCVIQVDIKVKNTPHVEDSTSVEPAPTSTESSPTSYFCCPNPTYGIMVLFPNMEAYNLNLVKEVFVVHPPVKHELCTFMNVNKLDIGRMIHIIKTLCYLLNILDT